MATYVILSRFSPEAFQDPKDFKKLADGQDDEEDEEEEEEEEEKKGKDREEEEDDENEEDEEETGNNTALSPSERNRNG